ncbi:hypothetical protein R0135_00660 [Congregibacter variabilis]|uniref:LPP20 lipoprotein n=1 Tax=Congregibacter variabilis TaxID=3081200 RepID=A0ABZ0I505_9GAMM|nr:hypothetical protein R0135_00660 [Congregibacter sp. IMCC43200]
MQVVTRLLSLAIAFMLLLGLPSLSTAQTVESKGIASFTYSSRFGPSAEDRKRAVVQANMSALERYLANSSEAKYKTFEQHRSEIEGALGDYIIDQVMISEDTDKKAKRLEIVLRATINATRLNVFLDSKSSVQAVSSGERSYMTFVFVARAQTSVKSYKAREFDRVDESSAVEGYEAQQGSGANVVYEAEESQSTTRESGGNSTQKSDVVMYDVFSSDGANTAMSEVFSTAGYEVVEAEYLVEESKGLIDVDQFQEDFGVGDDIGGSTRRNAVKGLQLLEIPYLALGTLDIGVKDIDSASGLTRVAVSVTGKVLDVSSRFPKTIAAVGPVQQFGLGPSETVARNNALKQAAQIAAEELTNQMNAKGVY